MDYTDNLPISSLKSLIDIVLTTEFENPKQKGLIPIELRHLEYFLMVSKELHFTRAAEKLGISQPTLSQQIKMLEIEIGSSLFNRIGKKIELTKVGEIVQREAMNIQSSLQSMSSQIEALTKVEIGDVKIAVLPGEMTDLVTTLCIRFNQMYPNIKVSVQSTDQVEKAVLENGADFGIGLYFDRADMLQVTKLYDEEFYLISNQSNVEEKISFSDCLDGPLILFPNTHQCRKLLDSTSCEVEKLVNPIVETSSVESILKLVRNGVGRSVVSRTLFEFNDTADLYFQQIEKPSLTREVNLIMKKNCLINYAARKYVELLIREIEKLHFHTEKEAMASLQSSIL